MNSSANSIANARQCEAFWYVLVTAIAISGCAANQLQTDKIFGNKPIATHRAVNVPLKIDPSTLTAITSFCADKNSPQKAAYLVSPEYVIDLNSKIVWQRKLETIENTRTHKPFWTVDRGLATPDANGFRLPTVSEAGTQVADLCDGEKSIDVFQSKPLKDAYNKNRNSQQMYSLFVLGAGNMGGNDSHKNNFVFSTLDITRAENQISSSGGLEDILKGKHAELRHFAFEIFAVNAVRVRDLNDEEYSEYLNLFINAAKPIVSVGKIKTTDAEYFGSTNRGMPNGPGIRREYIPNDRFWRKFKLQSLEWGEFRSGYLEGIGAKIIDLQNYFVEYGSFSNGKITLGSSQCSADVDAITTLAVNETFRYKNINVFAITEKGQVDVGVGVPNKERVSVWMGSCKDGKADGPGLIAFRFIGGSPDISKLHSYGKIADGFVLISMKRGTPSGEAILYGRAIVYSDGILHDTKRYEGLSLGVMRDGKVISESVSGRAEKERKDNPMAFGNFLVGKLVGKVAKVIAEVRSHPESTSQKEKASQPGSDSQVKSLSGPRKIETRLPNTFGYDVICGSGKSGILYSDGGKWFRLVGGPVGVFTGDHIVTSKKINVNDAAVEFCK